MTSLLLAAKEADKVSIELRTSPNQTQLASARKMGERIEYWVNDSDNSICHIQCYNSFVSCFSLY